MGTTETKVEAEDLKEFQRKLFVKRASQLEMHHPIASKFQAALYRYAVDRIEPGSFLRACLENDFKSAMTAADGFSLLQIQNLAYWIINVLPADAQGSREKVEAWLRG